MVHRQRKMGVVTDALEARIIEFLREYVGRGGVITAQKVLRVAYEGVLPPQNVAEILADRLSRDWEAYQLYDKRIQVLKAQADALVPHSPAAVIETIPGISNYLAARYLAGIRDIKRFQTPRQIWAFAGLDPILDSSGDSQRIGKISKHGDPSFRETLYLIGFHTAAHCPQIKSVFDRAFRRYDYKKKDRVAATIHAANAANKLVFRLLIEQRPYLPHAPR
jgi:transposase